MIEFFLEALDVPQPGWPGRRRYIAHQLWRMAIEAAVLVLLLAALLGCVLVTWAAMLPPAPR